MWSWSWSAWRIRAARRADDGRRTQPICARAQFNNYFLFSCAFSGCLVPPPPSTLLLVGAAAAWLRRTLARQHVRRSGLRSPVHLPQLAGPARLLRRTEAGRRALGRWGVSARRGSWRGLLYRLGPLTSMSAQLLMGVAVNRSWPASFSSGSVTAVVPPTAGLRDAGAAARALDFLAMVRRGGRAVVHAGNGVLPHAATVRWPRSLGRPFARWLTSSCRSCSRMARSPRSSRLNWLAHARDRTTCPGFSAGPRACSRSRA